MEEKFQFFFRSNRGRWGSLEELRQFRKQTLPRVKGVIHASITRVGCKPSHAWLRHLSCKCTRRGCHWHRGNMVEARVPRALSSIRYDTLTFLRCRMRKTMAAASWINDTIHGSIQEDEAGHRLTFSASRACLVTRLYCNHTFVRGEIKPLLFMGPPLLPPLPRQIIGAIRIETFRENLLISSSSFLLFFFYFTCNCCIIILLVIFR